MRSAIYLQATLSVYHPTIIPHFIQHYVALGVEPQRFLITLNARTAREPLLHSVTATLNAYGILPAHHYLGEFDSAVDKRHSLELQRAYTQPSDWIICCDADEFHQYPFQGRKIAEFLSHCTADGYDVIRGLVTDRVSADGRLKPITPCPSLAEQFPVCVDVTHALSGACVEEVMAHRAHLYTVPGNHCLTLDPDGAANRGHSLEVTFNTAPEPERIHTFPQILTVHHYKWDETLLQRLEYAAGLKKEIYWSREADAYLEHVRKFNGLNLEYLRRLAQPTKAFPAAMKTGAIAISFVGSFPAVAPRKTLLDLAVETRNHTTAVLSSNSPSPLYLSYHWLHADRSVAIWDGMRTKFRPPLPTGEQREYRLQVQTPDTPGTYLLQPAIVQEGVRWFQGDAVDAQAFKILAKER